MFRKIDKFSEQWFLKEAIKNVKQLKKDVWDFSSSALLYNPKGAAMYFQLEKAKYRKAIHDKEFLLIKYIAPQVVESLPNSFSYIDLGPGSGEKSELLLRICKSRNKQINYIPVDISKFLLREADKMARKEGFTSKPRLATFEELSDDKGFLNSIGTERFISLGLTYINYEPNEIHRLLKKLMGPKGVSFVTVQLRDRINLEEVKKVYDTPASQKFHFEKLRLLGINQDDIKDFKITDKIEIFAILKNVPKTLKRKGVKVGDKILFHKSLRPTFENFVSIISRDFRYVLYDKGLEFVAAVLKQKNT